MISIVIPSRTDAFLNRALTSIERSQPGAVVGGAWHIVVGDNGLSEATRAAYPKVRFVPVPDPFVFARSINLCVAQAGEDDDLLILNDDTEVLSPNFLVELEKALAQKSNWSYGILSPEIVGGVGNPDQMWKGTDRVGVTKTGITICFLAAVVRRELWESIGPLDERFTGYGCEDSDQCRRAVEDGWSLGVIGGIRVAHGVEALGLTMGGTFASRYGPVEHTRLSEKARAIFEAKWGPGPELGSYQA